MIFYNSIIQLSFTGYIDDLDGCKDVAKQFLEKCPLLSEFAEGYRRGARYSAKINNRTLLDFLQNPSSEKSTSSISQINSSQERPCKPFDESLLIATVKDTITKAFEDAFCKESEDHSRSFSQIKEEQAELKSILRKDLLSKIQDAVKNVESNIIQSLREHNNLNSHSSNLDLLKTPKYLFLIKNKIFTNLSLLFLGMLENIMDFRNTV